LKTESGKCWAFFTAFIIANQSIFVRSVKYFAPFRKMFLYALGNAKCRTEKYFTTSKKIFLGEQESVFGRYLPYGRSGFSGFRLSASLRASPQRLRRPYNP